MSSIHEKDAPDGKTRIVTHQEKGETNGFAMGTITDGNQLYLDNIHTIPAARGKGIGSIILHALFGWAQSHGCNEVTGDFFPEFKGGADEEAARKFYAKHGIKIDDQNRLHGKIH